MRAKVRMPVDDVCTDFVYVRVCVYVAGSPVCISPSLSLPLRICTHIRKFCVCIYICIQGARVCRRRRAAATTGLSDWTRVDADYGENVIQQARNGNTQLGVPEETAGSPTVLPSAGRYSGKIYSVLVACVYAPRCWILNADKVEGLIVTVGEYNGLVEGERSIRGGGRTRTS